nr:MAG TPA: hypothetical protein [Caudoviricetes sp.]
MHKSVLISLSMINIKSFSIFLFISQLYYLK